MKALSNATILLFLVIFLAAITPQSASATALSASVTCMDDELGGGLFARQYSCVASASGGTPPYTYDWQDTSIQQVVVLEFGDFAQYWKYNCSHPNNQASGRVVVEDSTGAFVFASDTITLGGC